MSLVINVEESRQSPTSVGAPIYATASVEGLYPPPDYDFVYQFSLAEPSPTPTYKVIQPYSIDRRCIFFSLSVGQVLLKCEMRIMPRRLGTQLDPETALNQPQLQMVLRKPSLIFRLAQSDSSAPTTYIDSIILTSVISVNVKTVGTQIPPCMIPLPNTISPIYIVPEHEIKPVAKVRIIIRPHVPPLQASTEQKKEQKNSSLFTQPAVVLPPETFSEAGLFTDAIGKDGTKKKGLFSSTKKDRDDVDLACNLCKGYVPPVKDLVITEWQDAPPGKPFFIPLFGILPNKLYEFRHQLLDPTEERRFELKEPIIFQAETIGMKSWLVPYQFTPLFAIDPRERNFFISTSGVPTFKEFATISGEKTSMDLFLRVNSSGASEAAMYTPYGQMMIFIHNSVQQGAKIIHCHKDMVMTISAGLCDWLHNGTFDSHFENQDDEDMLAQSLEGPTVDPKDKDKDKDKGKKFTAKKMSDLIAKSLQISSGSDSVYMNQYIYSSAINGSPMRMFSLGYINSFLLKKSLDSLDSSQEPVPYRPMVSVTYMQCLENNEIILAGLAEVPFTRTNYPVLFGKVAQQVTYVLSNLKSFSSSDQKSVKKVLGVDSSLLTAAIFRLNDHGQVIETFYACDMFPDMINIVQFTELAWSRNEKGCLIPGYYTRSKYALIHSYVSSVDCTPSDCLVVLPRQSAVIRLIYGSFKSTQQRSRAVSPSIASSLQPSLVANSVPAPPAPVHVSQADPRLQTPYAQIPLSGPYAGPPGNPYNTPYNAVGNPYSLPSANPYTSIQQVAPVAATAPSGPIPAPTPPTNPYALQSTAQPAANNPYLVRNPYIKPGGPQQNIDGDAPTLLAGLDALKAGADDPVILSATPGVSTCSDYLLNILGVCYPLAIARISNLMHIVCNTAEAVELIICSLPYFVGCGSKTHNELLSESTGNSIVNVERYDTTERTLEPVTVHHKLVLQKGKANVARVLTLPQGGCVVAWMEDGQSMWKYMEINNGLLIFAGKITNAEDIAILPTF